MTILSYLKRLLSFFPINYQNAVKQFVYRHQIRRGTFITTEPEYGLLNNFVSSDDWIIDVGANIGHYTIRFSEIIGPKGRVIAFEPILNTFSHLTSNINFFKCNNVTLINAAVSDKFELVGMDIPYFDTGLKNYYRAHLTNFTVTNEFNVLTVSIDSLAITHRVSLVKIDAEGHELAVLKGMLELIRRDHPILIVETDTENIEGLLAQFGYTHEQLKLSPNKIFRFVKQP